MSIQENSIDRTNKFLPHFDNNGLLSTIVCDYKTNDVLMFAYMNEESLQKTLADNIVCFYSRSRKKLWIKGESSGNFLKVKEMYIDCDQDCLLIKVVVKGDGHACHTKRKSCFYRKVISKKDLVFDD